MAEAAIPAATLVVMRDSTGSPPQLLSVTRGRDMAFAGMTPPSAARSKAPRDLRPGAPDRGKEKRDLTAC